MVKTGTAWKPPVSGTDLTATGLHILMDEWDWVLCAVDDEIGFVFGWWLEWMAQYLPPVGSCPKAQTAKPAGKQASAPEGHGVGGGGRLVPRHRTDEGVAVFVNGCDVRQGHFRRRAEIPGLCLPFGGVLV